MLVFGSKEELNTDSPLELAFQFESLEYGRFFCCSDGESLCWDNEKIEEADLGEYGYNKIIDVSSIKPWSDIQGKKLENVFLIESDLDSKIIGIKFRVMGNGKKFPCFRFHNNGNSRFCIMF